MRPPEDCIDTFAAALREIGIISQIDYAHYVYMSARLHIMCKNSKKITRLRSE